MSSPKLAAAIVRFAALVVLIISPGPIAQAGTVSSLLPSQQPRDPRTNVARPETQREVELKSAVAADPREQSNWLELAKLQYDRGAVADVEATYKRALEAVGPNKALLHASASFFTREGRFDSAIEALEAAAALNPADPAGYQLVATYYWEKAFKDHSITPADKARYIDAGIAATDRALVARADFIEALTYKNILLRMKAQVEPDASRRDALIVEADGLRAQAMELQKARGSSTAGATGPPAPGAPLRVGGDIKVPTKIQHVSPVYPPEAQSARVSGVVIIEATISAEGSVESAQVLRSIPMLDEAALAAVKQWRFAPTILNGAPVPVIMTVTVNFTLQ